MGLNPEAFLMVSLPPSVPSDLPPSVDSDGNMVDVAVPSRTSLSLTSAEMPEIPGDVYDSELPAQQDLESDLDELNAFDADHDIVDEQDEAAAFDYLHSVADHSMPVPTPGIATHLSIWQDVAEYYSPPRVVKAARLMGLSGVLSLDLVTGWDFNDFNARALSIRLLLLVELLILSPPCTAFCVLQRLWNYKRMCPEKVNAMWAEGMVHLEHAMACAHKQFVEGRFFIFEHPASASSWGTPCVQAVKALPGVRCVTIDMCMLGLVSKCNRIPMRKRTRIMTNSNIVVAGLQGYICQGAHKHQIIQGSEGGVRRSVWAQVYPGPLVQKLAGFAAQLKHQP